MKLDEWGTRNKKKKSGSALPTIQSLFTYYTKMRIKILSTRIENGKTWQREGATKAKIESTFFFYLI